MNALTTLSEEEELFRKTVRDFADREVAPRANLLPDDHPCRP